MRQGKLSSENELLAIEYSKNEDTVVILRCILVFIFE